MRNRRGAHQLAHAIASSSGVERVRRFAQAMLARGEDAARVQVRADLWTDLLTEDAVRRRLAEATQMTEYRFSPATINWSAGSRTGAC